MNIAELTRVARTCRRFSAETLSLELLEQWVDAARLCPSARNAQVLRYGIIASQPACQAMYGVITLGGALTPEQRPTPAQMPKAFIVIYGPTDLAGFGLMDVGIAAQTINLLAAEQEYALCMVGAFNRPALAKLSPALLPEIDASLDPKLVLAIGKPAEIQRIVAPNPEESRPYYRDSADVHCVPKLALNSVVLYRH